MEVLHKTEVTEYDMPRARKEDICRFDIAVDDPAAVEEFEGNNLVYGIW
jgi:hypothetical protein